MNNMHMRLRNKHTLITGGGSGIGLATTEIFAEAGAKCSVCDLREEDHSGLAPLKKLMKKFPGQITYLKTDITNDGEVDHFIEQAQKNFGPITTLFNNAAIFDMAPLLESHQEMYDKLFDVNVKGMFFLMQKVLSAMVKSKTQGGSIINLSSQAGRRGEALVSHYCATKAAVISYTQSAALAMAHHKIRVNALAPGVINTPMWQGVDELFSKYEKLKVGEKKIQVGKAVPLGYMGQPREVAQLALFLASDESSYITGQTINVDGGNVLS